MASIAVGVFGNQRGAEGHAQHGVSILLILLQLYTLTESKKDHVMNDTIHGHHCFKPLPLSYADYMNNQTVF